MKNHYKMKKTISFKQFIAEFGEGFSKHMKQRLLELGTRCILTRKENSYILDLKHVEHTKYDSRGNVGNSKNQKEYAYGQFVMNEGTLFFSKCCIENDDVMQISAVNDIYNSLRNDAMYMDEGINAKRIDDSNIDFVVDNILEVCPEVSAEHLAILSKYI